MILEILFFCFIAAIKIHDPLYRNHHMEITSNKIFCSNADLILNPNNVSYICYQGSSNITFENKPDSILYVGHKITVINRTESNYFNYNLSEFHESIIITENAKLIFSEFVNLTVVNSIANTFSDKNLNLWLTMDWMKHSENYSHYCQWDKTTIKKEIYDYFDSLTKNSRWKKICLNDQAYLHYSEKIEGEIIVIPKFTFVICFCSILAAIIFIICTLYCVAKCNTSSNHPKRIYPSDSNDNNDQEESFEEEEEEAISIEVP